MKHSLKDMEDAAVLMMQNGKRQEAFDICCVALKQKDAPRVFNAVLAEVAIGAPIRAFNPVIKDALHKTMNAYGVDAQKLALPWLDMLRQDAAFDPIGVFFSVDYVFNMQDWINFESCLNEPYLLDALKNFQIQDEDIEIALRNIRKILLTELLPNNLLKAEHLDFICALAIQCFSNEYVYLATPEEKELVRALNLDNVFSVAVYACYEPLQNKDFDKNCSGVAAFRQLLKVQIEEPALERELSSSIPNLDNVEDDVSIKVKSMYEENPYPRWRSLNIAVGDYADVTGDILVAGCGTGRYALQAGILFPAMKVAAVDISMTSLGYARRMADHYKARNVQFARCDILNLEKIPENFDAINCSGVLHHMSDPEEGWRSLIKKLKPGGVMLIGLYSTIARKIIFEAQAEIQKLSIPTTADGIRNFREHVFALPSDDNLKRLVTFKDFFSMSETRDLLFHVQEKTYTIPELQDLLDRLGLEFLGFKIPSIKAENMYKDAFPGDKRMLNLKNWEIFENNHPTLFEGMYNFVCKRKNEPFNETARRLNEVNVF